MIDDELLNEIQAQAAESPRLRMNYNIHESLDSPCQRLINVLLPGTALPIHRHQHASETYVILRGKLVVVLYADNGTQSKRVLLDPSDGKYGFTIPRGQWHSVEVIEPTAILEVKEGPYRPLEPADTMD